MFAMKDIVRIVAVLLIVLSLTGFAATRAQAIALNQIDTDTPTATETETATPTDAETPTPTETETETSTPTPTDTETPTPTTTETNTPTSTLTPTATNTPTLCYTQTQIPPTECNALQAFYNGVSGTWRSDSYWLQNDFPCDSWQGITCTDGHVTTLYVFNNDLTGTITPQLGNLTELEELYLTDSQVSGPIPAQLGNLTHLTILHLEQNNLNGPIPPQLGNLKNLTDLDVSGNSLTGSIPPQLGGATNLQYVGLNANRLSGPFPPSLGNLTHLVGLSIWGNKITGNIPPQMGNLKNLEFLYLDITDMAGEIPASFVNLTNLYDLSINCGQTSSNPTVIQFINNLIPGWQNMTCLSTVTFKSNGLQDGWTLESTENSNIGGTLNSTLRTFNLGDDARKKQYRGILSFTTQAIPDNATILKVILKVKRSAVVGGGNPLAIFQGFMADIKNGFFGASTLQAADFQTLASGTYGPITTPIVNSVYSINLTAGASNINKLTTNGGTTQIRLRFKLDDNNNAIANYLSLFSGNATNIADRPQLVVTYYAP